MGFENMQKEWQGYKAAEDAATHSANVDNRSTTATLQHKRRMKALGMGLKACLDSGLTRAEIHGLVDTVFDEAGKA